MSHIVCVPKSLTPSQAEVAIRRSIEINPANAMDSRTVERTPIGRRGGPRRAALLIASRWPATGVHLSVQFLDDPTKELRRRILLHMNAWGKTANVQFEETRGTGQVRIARLDRPADLAGYWSYVGTQILAIEDDQPTLNLEGFTMRTSAAEFRRVVRHEAGHTIGLEHEHMRSDLIKKIDRRKCIAYFDRTQGWTEKETIAQVLTPLSARSIMGTTEADPLSIMCYEIPGEITKDGEPIRGGIDINSNDFAFAARVYPKAAARPAAVLVPAPVPLVAPALRQRLSSARKRPPWSLFNRKKPTHFTSSSWMDSIPSRMQRTTRAISTHNPMPSSPGSREFSPVTAARVTSAMRLEGNQRREAHRIRRDHPHARTN